MFSWLRVVSCGVALLGATSARVAAHHSFAMYDQTKLVTLVGTVKELQWTNPHVILWVTQDSAAASEPDVWTLELPTSTGNLNRMGWSKHSLVAGDRVAVELNPLRDGKHGGSFKKATIEGSGKVLIASATPPPAAADGGAAPSAAAPASPVAPSPTDKPDSAAAAPPKSSAGCSAAALASHTSGLRLCTWSLLALAAATRRRRAKW